MSDSDSRSGKPSPIASGTIALIAALAGFGIIFWFFAGNDPESETKTADSRKTVSEAPVPQAGAQGPLAGLNKGDMAAFVIRKSPEPLPELPLETAEGEAVSLADFEGKVVLLNIWATWCHPCREEMPALNALQQKLGGEQFDVVAMNIDRGSPEKALDFMQEVGADDLAFYHDPSGKLFTKLKAVGMPTTLLIDAEGRELGRLVGPAEWDSPEAVRLIEAALAAKDDGSGQDAAGG